MLIKKRKPNLRFTDFKEDWVFKKLGDVGALISGLTYSPKDIGSNGVLVLRSSNVQKGVLVFDDNVYVNSVKYNPVFENDILICVRNGSKNLIGKNALITKEAEGVAFGAFMTVFRSDLNRFVFQLLATNSYFRIIYQNLGATINSINGSDLKKFIFFFPKEKQEQQKIANFLSAIDNRIQTLVKKKTLLEQYKKGVMQEVFKQELRFKDDTSTTLSASDGKAFPEWEEKKLGQTGNIKKGKQLNKEELTLSGTYPCQNGGISPSGYTEEYNTVGNTITISEGGNSCGYVNYMQSKFWCGGHCYSILELKKEVNALFLFQYLKFNEYGIMRLRVGSGLPNIQKKDLLMFEVKLPCIEEQTRIANFLSAIDKNIELVTKKIEHTKTYKKGLLQQMFV
jgi:type I restriction enzyme S subunit